MRYRVEDVRCEYQRNPVGLDVKKPRFSWKVWSDDRNIMQAAYQVQVSDNSLHFSDIVWDTGKMETDQSVHVEYAGPELHSRTRYYYRVRVWIDRSLVSEWSEVNCWETGLLSEENWSARWITGDVARNDANQDACLMLRSKFSLKGNVKRARLYATALGLYELYLNGRRVGDWHFTPGWTSYNKRLQYQTYDVTELLHADMNAIGALIGGGWYKGNLAYRDQRNIYGNESALMCQLHITYADDTEEMILSDEHWRSATGPIIMSEIYHGETYDARLEKNGWNLADFNDADWSGIRVVDHSYETLIAQENMPTRIIQEIKPVSLIQTPLGETVLDIGQNMVGWMHFRVSGERGRRITLQHAEVLDQNGNFYMGNLRSAKQTINYVLKGGEEEEFEPRFSFQGFRYVKVEGWPGDLDLSTFTAKVIHTDNEITGMFECSDQMINKLQQNIVWGQKGNFLDVPTDCPQRDERLGWTGDAHVFMRTASYNMNTALFFTKWLRDLKADQLPNGGVPHVIPHVLRAEDHSSSAWGDAAVICPWTLYLCYGDRRILEQQYDSMKAWVEYIRYQGENEYLWNTGFHFGDWLGLDAKENSYEGATPKDLIATIFYAYSTHLLKETAMVLNRSEDAAKYEQLHQHIMDEFNNVFISPNGRLISNTQTAHVLALMFDVVKVKDRQRVADALAQLIIENNVHLTTGFVGTPYLCHVLSRFGYDHLAYQLVFQKEFPSWLYAITKGATTIWEHWDGIKEDGSFWSDDMNSFNHYAYGAVGDWLYRTVAGIDTATSQPGYKHIIINPTFGSELNWVKASYESLYGTIRSEWSKQENGMEINIAIPPNTTAQVIFKGINRVEQLEEGGSILPIMGGLLSWDCCEDHVALHLGSGNYSFRYKGDD
ncbi:alpha-l-rhamnosidase [Paenibacillus algicola]|uniref:alpha-L-rhamnosidase n=2 Tax=Paenibacillus TaxID=44249 RepID=A0A4P8XGC7_9BACL|nr:alpha-l-rhamnosidase [Paenibacillus algicola]